MNALAWMVPDGSRIAHAFAEAEVTARVDPAVPLRHCGEFPLANLRRDEFAERCRVCQHAVDQQAAERVDQA